MFSYGEQPYGSMNGIFDKINISSKLLVIFFFYQIQIGSEVYNYIQSRNRLQKPSSCPKNTYRVMLQCWDWQEDLRPTFKELNLIFQDDSDYQKTLPVLRSFR